MSVLRADRALVLLAGVAAVLLSETEVRAEGPDDSFPVYWNRDFPAELQPPADPAPQEPYPNAQPPGPVAPVVQFGTPAQPNQTATQVGRPVLLGPAPGVQQAPVQAPASATLGAPVQLWPQAPIQPQQRTTPPPVELAPPVAPSAQQPRMPTALPPPGSQPRSVQARPVRDAVGVLDTETNGSLGPEIWAGTSRDIALRGVQQMPDGVNSPFMRNLGIRALLTKARAPEGLDPVTWAKARFRKLFQMGELLEAVELAHAASDQFQDEELARNAIEALLLAGVEEGACLDVRAKAAQFDTAFWQQALAYCRMEAGEQRSAQALVANLRERGVDDPVFYALFDAMNGAKVNLPGLRDLSPLQLAMAQAAKVPLPAGAVSVQDPTRLAAIARQSNLSPEIRLQAAERAGQLGTLSPEGLGAVYRSVPPGGGEASTNGALYRSIRSERGMGKRAQLLARWFQQARWPADPASRLRLDMIRPLDATPLTAPLAPFAAKALLAAGDAEMAWPWLDMAASSNQPEAQRQVELLWPLAVMYDRRRLDRGLMNRWVETASQMPNGPARVTRVIGVLNALGYELPSAAMMNMSGRGNDAGLQQLAAAAGGKRVGETILLSLTALGREGLAGADPLVVATVIRSLREAGLELEARAAAREAIAAAIS